MPRETQNSRQLKISFFFLKNQRQRTKYSHCNSTLAKAAHQKVEKKKRGGFSTKHGDSVACFTSQMAERQRYTLPLFVLMKKSRVWSASLIGTRLNTTQPQRTKADVRCGGN